MKSSFHLFCMIYYYEYDNKINLMSIIKYIIVIYIIFAIFIIAIAIESILLLNSTYKNYSSALFN